MIDPGFETPIFARFSANLERCGDNTVTLCAQFCGDSRVDGGEIHGARVQQTKGLTANPAI
jgi:hypothetical protein